MRQNRELLNGVDKYVQKIKIKQIRGLVEEEVPRIDPIRSKRSTEKFRLKRKGSLINGNRTSVVHAHYATARYKIAIVKIHNDY